MRKLELDALQVDTFSTTSVDGSARGTVAGHEAAPTLRDCPYSYGGTCVISGCLPCPTDDPCN